MNTKNLFLCIAVLLITSGCYGTLRGKVIDAETGEPIEGAVALAEWTRTKGFGNTYTVSAKVVTAVSDKDGNIELEGCYRPFVNEPDLTIYKKGYVAWNNDLIFPSYQMREGFEWNSGLVFKMERFKEGYSYTKHESFIYNAAFSGPLDKKENFIKYYRESEEKKVIEERRVKEGERK